MESPEAFAFLSNNRDAVERVKTTLLASGVPMFKIRSKLQVVADALVRGQYAAARALRHEVRVQAAQRAGHLPPSAKQMLAQHPGYQMSNKVTQLVCEKAVPQLRLVFRAQAELTEEDFDEAGIPETKEQAEKRAKGQRVKSELRAGWRWRFVWANHAEMLAKWRRIEEEQAAEEETKSLKAQQKAEKSRKIKEYKETSASTRVPAEDDIRCEECKGLKSVWEEMDMQSVVSKRKKWRQPQKDKKPGATQKRWFCPLCGSACTAANKMVEAQDNAFT